MAILYEVLPSLVAQNSYQPKYQAKANWSLSCVKAKELNVKGFGMCKGKNSAGESIYILEPVLIQIVAYKSPNFSVPQCSHW